MNRRRIWMLKGLLEKVVFEGCISTHREFLLLVYGDGQKKFTSAVRNYIQEIWSDLRDDISANLGVDLSETSLIFSTMPNGQVLISRDDLLWCE